MGNCIEGSNPSLSAVLYLKSARANSMSERVVRRRGRAPLAQLDRALDYESKGRGFESLTERTFLMSADPFNAQMQLDVAMMREALALARQAAELNEVPVGAVAVKNGIIIGRGMNRREIDADPLSHAEMHALAQAAQSSGAWRLAEVTLYVTLEPCLMCAGAALQSRISRLVYATPDPKAGAVTSLYQVLSDARLNHQVEVQGGVLQEEASALLKVFFKGLRDKK
jgi:tRNA(adenine34) deaminase